jgi:hypothetical protein
MAPVHPTPQILAPTSSQSLRLLLVGLIFVCLLGRVAAESPDRIIATVNNTIITARDIEYRFFEWNLLNNFPREIPFRELERDLIAATVFEEILYQRVWRPRMDIDEVEVTNWSRDAIERYQRLAGGARELRRSLTDMGLDETTFMRWIERSARRQWIIDQGIAARLDPAMLNRAGETSANATRVWIARLHVEAQLPNDEGSMERARELAASLRARAVAGEDFFQLATLASDEVLATRGGDMGWIATEALRPEIRDLVVRLRLNEVSQPHRARTGWQLYKLLDYETPMRRALIAEVRKTRRQEFLAAVKESEIRFAPGLELEQIIAEIEADDSEVSVWESIRSAPPEPEEGEEPKP